MTTAALALFAFLAGMVAVEFLIHRPDRKRQAAQNAALMAENKSLRMQRDSAQADLALVSDFHDYNTDVLRRVAAERDELQTAGERSFAMPTLAGIRAEARDNPPDAVALAEEFRQDFGGLLSVTPLDFKRKGAK